MGKCSAIKGFDTAFNRYLATIREQEIPLHGVSIIYNGTILKQECFGKYTEYTLHRMYSIAKSFAGLAVGCLADEGRIDLDDNICKYFPEMIDERTTDYLKSMTIRDMLSMKTCYGKNTYGADSNRTKSYFVAAADHAPGTVFNYDTAGAFTLGALVEKITGMKLLDYLRVKFLDEIGFSKEAYIIRDAAGVSDCGSGLMCSMDDLIKVSEFLMNKGLVNGRRLISKEYLEAAFSMQTATSQQDSSEERHGYGYMLWKTRHDGFCMYGMGGQLAACFPKEKLIYVTIADTKENVAGVQLLWRAFYDYLYPLFNKEDDELRSKCTEAFPPMGGKSVSVYEQDISGKVFECLPNEAGVKKFLIDTQKNIFIISDETGEYEIPFGRDEWLETPVFGMEHAIASANWMSDTAFGIKVYVYGEELTHAFFEIGVKDDTAVMHMRASGCPEFSRYKGKYATAKKQGENK